MKDHYNSAVEAASEGYVEIIHSAKKEQPPIKKLSWYEKFLKAIYDYFK